jgi:type IV pilus assembly protein PilM
MRSPRVLAVDVGAGHVACGVFTAGATGRLVLQHFALEPHNADPSHESRWAVEIAQSLGSVASRHKLSGPCAIAVPGHLALTKFIKTTSVAREKRGKIVAFEAAENIPYPLEEVVWDFAVVSDDSFDLEVMLAAVKFDAMQSLCAAADSAGFPVEQAVPSALALYNGFRYNHPRVQDSVIVVNIGARSTNLLFIEGERFHVRTLPLAGNTITQAIAEELRIDFPQAEALKVQVLSGRSDLPPASPSRAAVERAATAFANRLQLEITRSSVNIRRQTGGAAPAAVYLSGGGSLLPELPALLAEKLKLRVERYHPLQAVDVAADARAAGAETAAPVLADLVGLATQLIAEKYVEASLLPPAITQAIAFRKRQPLLLAAAALLLLALVPPIYYLSGVAATRLEQVGRYDDELMPLRSLQSRNDENLRQIDEATKQIAALRPAHETKANWIAFFADLQSRLMAVEDVWLDRVQIDRPSLADSLAEAIESRLAATEMAPEPADRGRAGADRAQAATDGAATRPPPPPPMRLTLSGRLLDVANPQSKVSPESFDRVKRLLEGFKGSAFVASVENERFDNNQNGLLRFDVTVVIDPRKPL